VERTRGPLEMIADNVLSRHIENCRQCEFRQSDTSDAKWKPCEFHRGYVAGIIGLINQINVELESAGFYG
jgi:hypothetical protein